jgi:Ca2+-binding RTX toxin-like protein
MRHQKNRLQTSNRPRWQKRYSPLRFIITHFIGENIMSGISLASLSSTARLSNNDDVVRVDKTGYDEYKVTINGQDQFVTRAQLQAMRFDLGGGNDKFTATRDVDVDLYVQGGSGDDQIKGGSGNDTMLGGEGNDLVRGGYGNDTLYGADASGGSSRQSDKIYGGRGDDRMFGSNGDDKMYASMGNDMMYGLNGNDHLSAGEGNDRVDGGNGDDQLYGGKGADMLMGGWGDDKIHTGADKDRDVVDGGRGKNIVKSTETEGDSIRNAEKEGAKSGGGGGGILGFIGKLFGG